MAEQINKMIIEFDGKEYEFDGGGGGQPGPDTVGTEQIIDGAVQEQDLNDSVKDRMTVTHDSSTGGLRIGGYAKPGNVPADNAELEVAADDSSDDI